MLTVISWNTRGDSINKINEVYDLLFSRAHNNVIMIQEAGNVGHYNGEEFPVTFGRRDGDYYGFTGCFFGQAGALNPRCTTGILVEECSVRTKTIFCYPPLRKRPIVCCECVGNDGQKYALATVHSTANEGIAMDELNDINLAFRYQYAGADIKWLVIGDLNCQAERVVPDLPMNLICPSTATHESGKTLDFALYSDNLKGQINIRLGGASGSSVIPAASDHFPICCTIL